MSDRSERTEKATPQKLRKAREEGQFPQAKEFVSAVQFAAVVTLIVTVSASWLASMRMDMHAMLASAFTTELSVATLPGIARRALIAGFGPLAVSAGVLLAVTLAAQLLSTNMGVSLQRLAPSFKNFNPMSKLRSLPKQNMPMAIQAVVLMVIMVYFVKAIVEQNLPEFLRLPFMGLESGIAKASDSIQQLLWRMAGLVLLFGMVDLLRQRWMYHGDLSMTKQEIKDEHKQQEGDPHVKGRIRRLRRDLLRRQMMKEVPTATAVIVNPTHFAVAIRYEPDKMASPIVVAKGRNFIAARIRQIATENGVAIVENPPLARALFDAVDIGREIPQDFYRAVAEVLAYVYRLTGMRHR